MYAFPASAGVKETSSEGNVTFVKVQYILCPASVHLWRMCRYRGVCIVLLICQRVYMFAVEFYEIYLCDSLLVIRNYFISFLRGGGRCFEANSPRFGRLRCN